MSYNDNPELAAMRDDIAKRRFKLTLRSMAITGAFIVVGAIAGALLLPMTGIGMFAAGGVMSAYLGGAVGLMLGGHAAHLSTLQDNEKLKIDEKYVDSYTQGKNHWGEGYRQEVAEHGYSLAGPTGLPSQQADKDVAKHR